MAVNKNNRRKTAYGNNVYVQGNTARKLQTVPSYEREETVKRVSNRTRKNRERAKHMKDRKSVV